MTFRMTEGDFDQHTFYPVQTENEFQLFVNLKYLYLVGMDVLYKLSDVYILNPNI
ncbi:unnamed protein product [Schistosoma curassoni]|uniref:Uncharacterized protein n=1 Tax=Schistosoma curassoni TaxID=6186 RepID=A0A183KG23_9TREM|nr:unnamed protein product [Schistosoma curassoni]